MKIEAHEAVTAFGRDVLLQAKQTAEEMGFRVLYFNVDGLYVQKQGAITKEDFDPLLEAVRARTGLRIDLEGIFRWLAFLPSRVDARVPVANRYFGMMQGDRLKVRGIEIRRHDTPPFIRKAQTEILHLLSRAAEGQPLESMLPAVLKVLARIASDVQAGRLPVKELVVSQRLSKELSQYKVPSPAARAAMQLTSIGRPMSPGQVVHFLYVRNAPGVLAWRAGLPYSYQEINTQEYLKLLVRAVSNILQPLGISERDLAEFVGVSGQIGFAFDLQKVLRHTNENKEGDAIAVQVDDFVNVRKIQV
jgi:DNA polymerase-2